MITRSRPGEIQAMRTRHCQTHCRHRGAVRMATEQRSEQRELEYGANACSTRVHLDVRDPKPEGTRIWIRHRKKCADFN